MTAFIFVSCLLVAVIGVSGKPPSAITGGEVAKDGEFPYMVALTLRGMVFCGGSIIDSRNILTAGHCVHNVPADLVNEIRVVTGTNNVPSNTGTSYKVKSLKKHAAYEQFGRFTNDIAVVTLTEAIKFDAKTKPVDLPKESDPGDAWAVSSGWGDLSHPNGQIPSNLRKLSLRVMPKGSCVLPKNAQVHSGQLCAVNKKGSGLCTGDSGGPLVHNGKIIGIASFVYRCGLGYPDVFTRVYEYLDWIRAIIKQS